MQEIIKLSQELATNKIHVPTSMLEKVIMMPKKIDASNHPGYPRIVDTLVKNTLFEYDG